MYAATDLAQCIATIRAEFDRADRCRLTTKDLGGRLAFEPIMVEAVLDTLVIVGYLLSLPDGSYQRRVTAGSGAPSTIEASMVIPRTTGSTEM